MRLPLLVSLGFLACSRPAAQPAPAASPRAPQASPAPRLADPTALAEAHEREEIAEHAANLSRFPSSDEGLRDFVTELARASASTDHERRERVAEELQADEARLGLAFSFEGARLLSPRMLAEAESRGRALRARLATLREPFTITLGAALGRDVTAEALHGFDPRLAAVRGLLRPMVRYLRVEVTGAQGSGSVVIEPMAWLGGRWTWLAEPWSALSPAVPATPAAPATR